DNLFRAARSAGRWSDFGVPVPVVVPVCWSLRTSTFLGHHRPLERDSDLASKTSLTCPSTRLEGLKNSAQSEYQPLTQINALRFKSGNAPRPFLNRLLEIT